MTLRRRMRILLPRGWRRRRWPLLLPGAKFLLLLPLLPFVSRLHRSYWLGQRMRPLLRMLSTVRGLGVRFLLRLRSPLRLPHAGLAVSPDRSPR